MRLAAQANVLDALATQIAGASLRRAEQVAQMEQLAELVTQLRSGGLSQPAALEQGLRVLAGREPMPRPTSRFAAVYGDPS